MRMKYPSLDQFVSENFDLSDDIGIEKTFDLIYCQYQNGESSCVMCDVIKRTSRKEEWEDILGKETPKKEMDNGCIFMTTPMSSDSIILENNASWVI